MKSLNSKSGQRRLDPLGPSVNSDERPRVSYPSVDGACVGGFIQYKRMDQIKLRRSKEPAVLHL